YRIIGLRGIIAAYKYYRGGDDRLIGLPEAWICLSSSPTRRARSLHGSKFRASSIRRACCQSRRKKPVLAAGICVVSAFMSELAIFFPFKTRVCPGVFRWPTSESRGHHCHTSYRSYDKSDGGERNGLKCVCGFTKSGARP